MEKTYLFFDIECANCFDGVGKMCSFGYVLVNEDFTVLDSDDVVMNPEAEFDWFLFDPKKGCQLAYSKDYFRAQHNFESYYTPIKKLMEASGRKILAFGSTNDIGFLQSACERYNLPGINYACYDMLTIIEQANGGAHKKLDEWCDFYGVDTANLVKHKSVDDAKMTMLLAKAFCQKEGVSIEELLERNKGIKISVEKYIEARDIARYKKEVTAKIESLYGKKARAVLTNRLSGEYAFGFKFKEDVDEVLELANLVYKHGGILRKSLKNQGTLIIRDDTDPESTQKIQSRGLKTLTTTALRNLCRME